MKRSHAFATVIAVAALAAAVWFVRMPVPRSEPLVKYANTYGSPQQFEEGIYAADHSVVPPEGYRIRGVIVPHHLTATASIASGVKMLSGQSFKKILLLSPDHFHKCPTLVCTANASYDTWFGKVNADPAAEATLRSSPLVTADPGLFKDEHGIFAVVPYVAHYFPGVPVTPVALSQKLPWRAVRAELLDLVSRAADEDTIVMVSSDFSHYLTLGTAEDMDEMTAEALFAKNLDGVASLRNPDQSDCPNCLWTLASLADARGFYNPSVVRHTNSADIVGRPDLKETTSHFSMVWYENASLSGDDLAVAGDVTLTRTSRVPKLPAAVAAWWAGRGPRFVNLEGPLAKDCAPQELWYLFCNSVSLWSPIKGLATHWGVENNHMLDLGVAGREETARIIWAGGETPVSFAPVSAGAYRLFALTRLINPVEEAGAADLGGSYRTLLAELKDPHPGQVAVVLVHAGEEYKALTTDAQEKIYESLIDAGADAVVVAHAHVVGDMRLYKNKPIFRGVGNFIFDQYDQLETVTAKLVRLRLQDDRVRFETLIAPTAAVMR